MPTWMERENNKRRERRRRAVSSKIYAGLRMYGNFTLSKHCDNNEVLKALCKEAGWIVEEDGTTYRKGCNPTVESMEIMGGPVSGSPYSSSYQPSPHISYNPSPSSSPTQRVNADSLIPWLKSLSSSSIIQGGSISAPVTPPSSSPTARIVMTHTEWDDTNQYSSTPTSPGRTQPLDTGPTSPTFSFVSRHPFGFASGGGSLMWTPGQSGTCSPALPPGSADGIAAEFAFGGGVVVNAWEGERIHEECVPDELELKL